MIECKGSEKQLACDSSITDTLNSVRKIALAVGSGLLTENVTTDLDGLKTVNSYLQVVVRAFGDSPIDNSSIVDSITAMSAMIRNFSKMCKCVS